MMMVGSADQLLATRAELEPLFDAASAWLITNGSFTPPDPVQPLGMFLGDPLHYEGGVYEATVSGERLRTVLPEAAAELAVRGEVLWSFGPAHWRPEVWNDDMRLTRQGAEVEVFLFGQGDADYQDVLSFGPELYADEHGAAVWGSNKSREQADDLRRNDQISPVDMLKMDIANRRFSLESGLGGLTVTECAALQQVADNLTELTA